MKKRMSENRRANHFGSGSLDSRDPLYNDGRSHFPQRSVPSSSTIHTANDLGIQFNEVTGFFMMNQMRISN